MSSLAPVKENTKISSSGVPDEDKTLWLPDDILQQIFAYLEGKDLVNTSCTCRRWKAQVIPSQRIYVSCLLRNISNITGDFSNLNTLKEINNEANNCIEKFAKQSRAFAPVCKQLLRWKQIERALYLAKKMDQGLPKDEVFSSVSVAFAKRGKVDQALEVAEEIQTNFSRCDTFDKISEALKERGENDKAEEVANMIPKECDWDTVKKANLLLDERKIDEAKEVAQTITNIEFKGIMFMYIKISGIEASTPEEIAQQLLAALPNYV